jgi:hypothetical protein
MKKPFVLLFILTLIVLHSYAQSDTISRFCLYSGTGYFADICQFLDPGFNSPDFIKTNPDIVGKIYNGKTIWFQYGYKLKTDFVASLSFALAMTKYHMNDPGGFFWDYSQYDSYSIIELKLAKEFGKRNNILSIGTGLLFRRYISQSIDYSVIPVYNSNNELTEVLYGIPSPSVMTLNDMGIPFDISYYHKFRNKFLIGMSCSANLIFDIRFETISISPFIGYKF